MKLTREAIQRMISQKQGTSNVTVINQGGGGGSVALGPLLTSLNSEAMPTAEGYLHWSGTAWEWTTPTGGDPVDLTPYALKTWVQNNFATLNDISGLLTKTQADGYYAPISFVKPYLPLAAGSSYPLTGSLYINGNNNGIQWSGEKGMLCYKPASGWSGVTSSQWGVGSHDADGIIRSGSALERYDGTNNYTIYDSSNLDPLNYLRKDGGTVAGTLNVKTLLNIQSSAGANKITLDGSTANIDIASGGQITFDTDSHIAHDATNDRLAIYGNNGLLIQADTYVGSVVNTNLVATQGYVGSSINTAIDNYSATVASTYATKTQLADYLPLIGGRLTGDLHIGPNSSSNFKKIYFGDGSYVWLGEETDDSLTIQASKNVLIKTGNSYKLTYNGYEVFTENGGTVTGICSFENDVDVSGRLSLNTDSYFEVGDNDILYIYGDAGVYFYNRPFVGSLDASAQVALLSDLATYATLTQLNTACDNLFASVISNVTVSGNYLVVSKNGANTSLTIPYATNSGQLGGHAVSYFATGSALLDVQESAVYSISAGTGTDAGKLVYRTGDNSSHAVALPYLTLTGGTLTGNLWFRPTDNTEIVTYYKTNRKKADGGGWVFSPMTVVGADESAFFRVGVYGSNNTLNYAYLGAGNWNEPNHLRIYDDGSIAARGIKYQGTKAIYDMITFIDNTADINGNGIAIGGGGATIIGGGESASVMARQLTSGGNEVMFIGNGQGVKIYTNLQDGWSYRKEFAFDTTGGLTMPGSIAIGNGAGLYIKDTNGTGQMAVFVNSSNQFFVGFGMRNAGYTGYFDSYVMHLRSGAVNSTTMTLDANNRVGIGTTTPGYKLDVNGEAKVSYMLFKNYNDSGNAGYCGRGASASNQIQLFGYTGNTVAIGANGGVGMTFDTNNNVGIGTSSPAYNLDVNGIVRATTGLMVRNGTSDAIGFDTTAMFFNKAQTGGSPITSTVATFTWDNTNQRIVVGFSATPKVGTTEVALKSDISFASRQNNVLTLTTDFLTATAGIECDDIIYASSDLKTGDSLYFGASASDDDGYGRLYADSSGNLWFQPTGGTAKRIAFV